MGSVGVLATMTRCYGTVFVALPDQLWPSLDLAQPGRAGLAKTKPTWAGLLFMVQ